MYSSIYAMRQELDRMRKPTGTRANPVRTCRDLFYGHPHFKDGKITFFSFVNLTVNYLSYNIEYIL